MSRMRRDAVRGLPTKSGRLLAALGALGLAIAPSIGLVAGPDSNIEWNGVSQVWW